MRSVRRSRYITINNPEKANILDRETSQEISEVWKEVWEDRDVRVAILTGAGNGISVPGTI